MPKKPKKLSPHQLRKLKEEKLKRLQRSARLKTSLLFGPQRAFVESQSKYVVASCSRRAGKSYGEAYKLLEWGLKNPGSIIPYITLTRESARDIIHAPLRELGEAANLDLVFKGNTGDVVMPNGSKIILRGCEDRRQIEKLRGPKYPGAVIDEAQGIPSYLTYLIHEVLGPALLDYPGSQTLVTGTPNASCSGVFYDMVHQTGGWADAEVDVHNWTMLENISYAQKGVNVEEELETIRKNRGLERDDPAFMREWLGIWVKDTESSVYKYKSARNDIGLSEWTDLRNAVNDWEFIMGLDLGWNDPSAFVVSCFSQQAGRFVVLDSYQCSEMSTDAIANRIRGYFQRFGEMPVYADSGGYGKSIVEGLQNDYGLPVIPAQKQAKASHIEFVNNDLRSAALRILQPANEELAECLEMLQWDDKSTEKGIPKEDKRTPNHLSDALLYSVRAAWHNDGSHVEHEPEFLSPEWLKREEEARIEAAIARARPSDDDLDATERWLDYLS